ncbi:MAG: hypothetical protein HPY50_00770 [Firmicutes bacterium]|nr:hypothetical protein [Bacillota bacterium]
MPESPPRLTEREEKLIAYLRSESGPDRSIDAAWALIRFAADLDSEAERLKRMEGQDRSELIKELRRKSRGLKALSRIIGGG